MSKVLNYLEELQDDLNTPSCAENDLYGNKWKAWYNVRLNKINQELSKLDKIRKYITDEYFFTVNHDNSCVEVPKLLQILEEETK